MHEEKESLNKNRTWELVDFKTKSKKLLHSKWLFKIKDNGIYKARLVVLGCHQREGIDYKKNI